MGIDLPLMGASAIRQVGKARIFETETRTTEIGVGRDANHRIHGLVEQAPM